MGDVCSKLTVFFEEPFWVGVFEKVENGSLFVAKVTFGAEPKDLDVDEFVLKHYERLIYSPAVATVVKETKQNPKRRLKQARREMQSTGIGTKSQQALKLQQEQSKQERKAYSKEQKEARELRLFELKQQKKKEKHKGH